MSPRRPGRTLASAGIVGLLVVVGAIVSPASTLGAIESVADDPATFGLCVAALYAVRPLVAWPTTPLAVVVGYGFGVAAGVPIALIGVSLTVIPPFLVVRRLAGGSWAIAGRSSLADRAADRARRSTARYFERAGPVRGVVVARLAPIPSDAATIAAAASGVTLRQLVVGTIVGELPWTIAAVVVGASAATLTTEGLGRVGAPLLVACTLAAALLLAGPVYEVARERFPERFSDRVPDG